MLVGLSVSLEPSSCVFLPVSVPVCVCVCVFVRAGVTVVPLSLTSRG